MKNYCKLPLLLLLLLFTVQCSTSTDPGTDPVNNGGNNGNGDGNNDGNGNDTGNETFSFEITVSGEWFAPDQSATLYISNQDGEILAQGAVQNNDQTLLEVPQDIATRFDATLLRRISFNGGFINSMTTYQNVSSGSFVLSRNTPEFEDLFIEVDNTGCLLDIVSTTTGGVGNGTSNNGGNYTYDTSVVPGGDYFILMRCPNSGITRYLWQEDITDASIYVDYSGLPTADVATTLTIPSNTSNTVSISGRKDTDPFLIGHRIELDEDANGMDFSGHTPAGIFDSYLVTYSIFDGASSFTGSQVLNEIPSSISEPSFDFSISTTGLDNFSVQSTGSFDGIRANYFYNDPSSPNSISYNVIGAAENNTLAPMSSLVDAIFATDPNINASSLEFIQAGASDYINANTFMEYVKFVLEFTGEATETPYKIENVIKSQ